MFTGVWHMESIFCVQQLNFLRRLEISQKFCTGSSVKRNAPGVCMFNFQCHQRGGNVIGTCIDGFLFGACCSLSAEALEDILSNEDESLGLTSLEDLQIPNEQLVNVEQHPAELELDTKHNDQIAINQTNVPSATEDGEHTTSVVTPSHITTVGANVLTATLSSDKGTLESPFEDLSDLIVVNNHEGLFMSSSLIPEVNYSTEVPTTAVPKDDSNKYAPSTAKPKRDNNKVVSYTTGWKNGNNKVAHSTTRLKNDGGNNKAPSTARPKHDHTKGVVSSTTLKVDISTEVSSTNRLNYNTSSGTETTVADLHKEGTFLPFVSITEDSEGYLLGMEQAVTDVNDVETKLLHLSNTRVPEDKEEWILVETLNDGAADNEMSSNILIIPSASHSSFSETSDTSLQTVPQNASVSFPATDDYAFTNSTTVLPGRVSVNANYSFLTAGDMSTLVTTPTFVLPLTDNGDSSIAPSIIFSTPSKPVVSSGITDSYSDGISLVSMSSIAAMPIDNGAVGRPDFIASTTGFTHPNDNYSLDLSDPLAIWVTKKPEVPVGTQQFLNTSLLIIRPEHHQTGINYQVTAESPTARPTVDAVATTPNIKTSLTPLTSSQSLHSSTSKETGGAEEKFATKPPLLIPLRKSTTAGSAKKPSPTTVPVSTPEPLLFWTTRRPGTRRPQPISENTTTIFPTSFIYLHSTTNFQTDAYEPTTWHAENHPSSYKDALQQIAVNMLDDNTVSQEMSTESWWSPTYPIKMNFTDLLTPVKHSGNTDYISIQGLNTFEPDPHANDHLKETSNTPPSDSLASVTWIERTTTDRHPGVLTNHANEGLATTETTVKPPLDLDLLVQLMNLTSYIPDAGIFIPPHLMEANETSNEIEGPDHYNDNVPIRLDSTTTTTIATSTPTSATTAALATETTTLTTTTLTTTTTTTEPTTTRRKWDWRKTCGVRPLVREGRIVNGRRSDFGEWPWQALVRESTWLGIFTKNKCGGVLLNARYVLTAAHCQPGFLASLIVVLGELDVSDDYEPKKTVQRNVKRVVVHKDFVARTFDNDLALLELDSPVQFDEHIVPICMPDGQQSFVGKVGYVSGWGRLSYQGSIPHLLHNVEVPVIPNKDCQKWFKEAGHSKVIKPEFICAGYKNGIKDSCEGDSGGPLSIRGEDSRWVLAGIVSHGIKCAYPNLPGVYMRMTYYKPWIDRIIN